MRRQIQLHFLEPAFDRLQEFTVRWLAADGGQSKEIVRQQWNFSPAGSTTELEDYEVNLDWRLGPGSGNKTGPDKK